MSRRSERERERERGREREGVSEMERERERARKIETVWLYRWLISAAMAEAKRRREDGMKRGDKRSVLREESLSLCVYVCVGGGSGRGLNIPCWSRAEGFPVVQISFVRSYLPLEDPAANIRIT